MGLAVLQYNSDNDEMMVPIAGASTATHWTLLVYPYVKNYGVYTCPDDYGPQ